MPSPENTTPSQVEQASADLYAEHERAERSKLAASEALDAALREPGVWHGDGDPEAALGEEDDTYDIAVQTSREAEQNLSAAKDFYQENKDALHEAALEEDAERSK